MLEKTLQGAIADLRVAIENRPHTDDCGMQEECTCGLDQLGGIATKVQVGIDAMHDQFENVVEMNRQLHRNAEVDQGRVDSMIHVADTLAWQIVTPANDQARQD